MSKIAFALALLLLLIGCAPKPAHATIAWQTASEFSVAGYIVERSLDQSGPFERVSPLIPSSADPFDRHEYEYVDERVSAGQIYYYQLVTITNANQRIESGWLSVRAQ